MLGTYCHGSSDKNIKKNLKIESILLLLILKKCKTKLLRKIDL